MTPVDRAFIAQLAEVWDDLDRLCRDLGPEDWDRPTSCPGWTVRDQLSHVVGTESALLGRPAPPPAPPLAHVRNPLGELNEGWIEARRGTPGPELLAEFEEVTAQRLATLAAMSDEELARPGWSPIGTVPYAEFMDVRVFDCWIHDQDIRQALGRPGATDMAAAATAARRLISGLGYVVGRQVAPPEGTSVVVELVGDQARVRAVEMRGGRALDVEPPAYPTVRIRCDLATYTQLVAGRADPEELLAQGSVELEGDDAVGRRVLHALNVTP